MRKEVEIHRDRCNSAMPQHRAPRNVTDKVAGLESHQFSRDEHRFAASPPTNVDVKSLPRQPRVGNNSRNSSDQVFKFGKSMAYDNDRERYISDVAFHEKLRLHQKREKLQDRIEVKRQWMSNIEKERWEKMSHEFVKEQELWKSKHNRSKLGRHSVDYNPITLEYHDTDGGRKLAANDAKAMYRTAVRATRLYLKNNSFDPMACTDIPKRLEFSVVGGAGDGSTAAQTSTNVVSASETGHQSSNVAPASVSEHATAASLPASNAPSDTAESVASSRYTDRSDLSDFLQRPKFGRRSYKIMQSIGAAHALATPRALAQVAARSAELATTRSIHAGGSIAPAVLMPGAQSSPFSVEADNGAPWVRHY